MTFLLSHETVRQEARRLSLLFFASLLSLATVSQATYADENTKEVFLAPGWGKLTFEAPAAGTYKLPTIMPAANGEVLNATGESLKLHSLMEGKISVLSFIYRTCDDVNGCPLSTMVLYNLGQHIAKDETLHGKVQLITMSFDPEFDTPKVMAEYGASLRDSDTFDWAFLTTASQGELKPILRDYQQTVVRDRNSKPGQPAKFSHLLRVYLIDESRSVRNIYSLSFLHPDILVNDVKTLLMEAAQ